MSASPTRRRIDRSRHKLRRLVLRLTGRSADCAYRLRIPRVLDDDTFISSYPKSGNTWLRFLVANLRHPDAEISFRTIESLVADSHKSSDLLGRLPRPRYIKTHFPEFGCFPRMLYIHRDVRDVLVSWFHFYGGADRYGDFQGFVEEDPDRGTGAAWARHVDGALRFTEDHPERALVLRYEDMLHDPLPDARQVADFCGLDLSDDGVRQAVERTSFRSLKRVEATHGGEFEGDDRPFFRKGRSGGWREELGPQDLARLDPSAVAMLSRLDYDDVSR